jgi:hypothetical protein
MNENRKPRLKVKRRKKFKNKGLKYAQERAKGENVQKMLKALQRYELRNKKTLSDGKADTVNDNELVKKRIYLKEPSSQRICGNCVYYIGVKCTFHSIGVTKNHGCYKFTGYRTVYGGGFSPR